MARKTSSVQKLRQQLRSARAAKIKKQMDKDMNYCPKCDWGWSAQEGSVCPNCGFEIDNSQSD